ncbi:MAG: DNA repair protein RecN [Bdellovibrio sp.]
MNKIVLDSLHLVNFATFENQEIKFGQNFNCIVGETGSGKSLILTAFLGLLGNRIDKKSIRKGAQSAIIEGLFTADKVLIERLDNDGYPSEDNTITIKRIISHNGTSKAYINGMICSSQYVSKFIRDFIDLVGQFENQKLLSPDYQLELLDIYSGNQSLKNEYLSKFNELKTIEDKINVLTAKSAEQNERKEFLRFQIEEFENAKISEQEESQLQNKREQAFNIERNKNSLSELAQVIQEDDYSLTTLSSKVNKLIQNLKGIKTDEAVEVALALNSNVKALNEIVQDLISDLDLDLDVNEIMRRLDVYQRIKRKYNLSIPEIMKKIDDYRMELNSLEQLLPDLKRYRQLLISTTDECHLLATKLHKNRVESAAKLSSLVTELLQQLNMQGARFDIKVTSNETLSNYGLTKIDFQAETNKGEGTYSIKDIASGGELSRILLCLRQIISSKDSISIFFFDEIDTGIGGETAVKIGKLLSSISRSSQVITITHLPQIANSCDHIISVSKQTVQSDEGPRTLSMASLVEGSSKKAVIDSMIAIN